MASAKTKICVIWISASVEVIGEGIDDDELGRSGRDPSLFYPHKSYEHVLKSFLALLPGKK